MMPMIKKCLIDLGVSSFSDLDIEKLNRIKS